MAARCAAAFGRTHSLAGSQNGSAYPTAQAKMNDPRFRGPTCRRRRWYGGAVRRGLRPNPFARRLAKWVRYTTAQAKETGPRKGGRPVGGGGGMAARCAAAFGRTRSLCEVGLYIRVVFSKKQTPIKGVCFLAKDCYFNNIGVIVKFRNAHINPTVFWNAGILGVFLPLPLQSARRNHQFRCRSRHSNT